MTIFKRIMLAGGSIIALAAPAVQADTLSYASGWPPSARVTPVFEKYADTIEERTNGDLSMKIYPLSLLNFLEANEGVKNGIADLATMLTPYFAAEYPRMNMLSEASSVMALEGNESSVPAIAYAGMMTELVMLDCPSCQDEVKRQNQVSLGVAMTPPYLMACMTEITSAEELKGKRVRAGGAFWSRWVEAMEAVPVSLSINETFEALEQGVLDCSLGTAPDLDNFSLNEVVKHVYLGAPSGMFPFPTNMNLNRWQGLSEEQRAVMLDASAELIAGLAWEYHLTGQQALEDVVSGGNELTEVSDDLRAKSRAFLQSDLDALAGAYKANFGMEGGDELVQKISALAPRWIELVEDVNGPDELAEILKREIFSKVDAKTYGM
ncbi:TRAP-type C4-dicarboxylate transport system, substrate-binding protein [Lutimaribacter pacificus]|uniref:TRAP-type C4-dicarboxylate transport system, substrate-binding protein n=1 Tax=Lutimaribacter pacificus TaxID=391948 RepID=A0A1H0FXL9_9RHOB|nr:C4-dicarboxylate TRAP transporter substrate-binding protein [Lutimaribacter pacificus]SDN99416.1 TRAP-type C4-dicarboxylate transport system, substrate-binding protein [Lutimaribacter pacificus]SHJ82697.1 TRAP-type C4-dicarboxylate transport system, substrate-binding protein [Lutimaribacter pacificus]